MNAALEKYRDALKNASLSNNAIAKMAKVPEADVVAARAEIAAIEAAPKAPEVAVVEVASEVASEVEAVAEAVADVADAVDAPKVAALVREPGSAVRALRTQRIVDAKGKPWNVMFRDVFSGAQADFLASNHPGLVETYPRPKG